MKKVLVALGISILSLTACGSGMDEEEALADLRAHALTDQFATMDDNELTKFMRDMCREIDDDGDLSSISMMWSGFVFSGMNPIDGHNDITLITGNAVRTYCPEHQKAFDEHRDGEWADRYSRIHED